MSPDVPILTLDGPSGSGKGSVAQEIARRLGWHYLESGALYRVLGLVATRTGVPFDDTAGLVAITRQLDLRFDDGKIFLAGQEIDEEVRTERAGNVASRVARIPEVREVLLDWQRRCARLPGLVADGRDMGTVVFPRAGCKIYLTASAEARAQRRFNQLREKGFDVNIPRLFKEIQERDQRDAGRSVSPLRPADDAFQLDSTELSIEQVISVVLEQVTRAYQLS